MNANLKVLEDPKLDSVAQQTPLFTANAVHDLRGYLQLIASGISLFRRNFEKDIDVKGDQILVAMSHGVVRMKGLIDDILILSKASEDYHHLQLVDLNEVVRSIVADLLPIIEINHAKIFIHELPVVCGDESQLCQVFQNLLNNALKYRRPQVDPNISICSQLLLRQEIPTKDYLNEITVGDNGIGFSSEQAKSLFEAFHRLNNPGIEGSGLGLAICQKILMGHRGNIRAEGTPGVGAKFIIQLPSIECCEHSDSCPFAASSFDKKCPAAKVRTMESDSKIQ